MTFIGHQHMHTFVLTSSSGGISTYEDEREYRYQNSFPKVSGLTSPSGSFSNAYEERGDYHHRYPHPKASEYTSMSEPIRPHENDVLMGRGGKNNQSSGNEKLRQMARLESDNYRKSSKKGKSQISRQLVHQVRSLNPPGRFLKRDSDTGEWEDVGDDVAREKASQVLRDAVGLLPEEKEQTVTDPLPLDSVESKPYPSAVASVPVSVDESERAHSMYSQRPSPMLSHHSPALPVPTPVTSYRKRRRQHFYGYEGYQPEEVHSPVPSPTRRRYSYHHNHPHQHHSYPAYHPQSTRRAPPPPLYYDAYSHRNEALEPTLPLSHSESMHRHQRQTNRPPVVSSRQASTASAGSLLGELQSGMNEFDLFNGELIESDGEEQKTGPAPPRGNV